MPLAVPSGAATKPGITVALGQDASMTGGPILGAFPATAAAIPTPSGCGNATPEEDVTNPPPFGATCDRVPIHVVAPTGLAESDEFFLSIEVTWEDPTGENDIDIYLWDNNQIAQRDDPESGTFTQFGESAAGGQPEAIKVFRPDLGDYNLVVLNWVGVNFEYTVKASVQVAKSDAIFELLEEPVTPAKSDTAQESTPIDFSADVPAAVAPSAGGGLAETFILPDDDLDAGFGASGFEEAIAAPTDTSRVRGASAGRAAPVSGLTVFAWLVLLPAIVGAFVFWMLRRHSRLGFRFA